MDLGYADRVVVVTGASGGIGRAVAAAFLAEGAQVACHTHRRRDALQQWIDQNELARAFVVEGDIRDAAAMERLFADVRARCGRVDVCVANAAARPASSTPLHDCEPARVAETINNGLLGACWTARAFLRALKETGPHPAGGGANLLFVGSTAASFGEAGYTDYAAAKAGLFGLVKSLKNEIVALDPQGRVNLVEPGWTATHMARPALEDLELLRRVVRTMPLRQIARAADIARTALWLCSPTAARHITGQSVPVTGGMEGRLLWDRDDIDPAAVRADAKKTGDA